MLWLGSPSNPCMAQALALQIDQSMSLASLGLSEEQQRAVQARLLLDRIMRFAACILGWANFYGWF